MSPKDEAIRIVRRIDCGAGKTADLFRQLEHCFAGASVDCRSPTRVFLLWDGCKRQKLKGYPWPAGFKEKWRACTYRGLVNAKNNGPPRTAFTVAGGSYVPELAHLCDRPVLREHNLCEGRHFTLSANLVCVAPLIHRRSERDEFVLWLLRGLPFRQFCYDPLGAFSGTRPNSYGFADGRIPDVFWP